MGINPNKIGKFFAQFRDNTNAQELLEKIMWDNIPTCPKCNQTNCYALPVVECRYQCNLCKRSFSVRAGTILENSKLNASQWVFAIVLLEAVGKKITIKSLQDRIPNRVDHKLLSNNTASRIKKKIVEGKEENDPLVVGIINELRQKCAE